MQGTSLSNAIVILALLGVIFTARSALPFDNFDIQMHGFLSQGYLKSSDNYYLGDSQKGSFEFNEIGLNFAVPLSDTLQFGIQFFSHDIGSYGNNELNIDWAFLDYHFRDWFGFRAGKIKTPIGLYNRQRDADTLRTSILLEQTVYMEGIRDLVVAFRGASIYGSCSLANAGDIDYEIFTGTFDIPDASSFEGSMTKMIPVDYYPILIRIDSDVTLDASITRAEGCMLFWNTPVPGLKIGGTYLRGDGDIKVNDLDTDLNVDKLTVLSTEFEKGPVILAVECIRMNVKFSKTADSPEIPLNMNGWYSNISWRFAKRFSLGASYGEYFPQPNDKNGTNYKYTPIPEFLAWQKDTALSFRIDITDNWLLKLETHFMNGAAQTQVKEQNYGSMKKNWMLYAVKTSLSF